MSFKAEVILASKNTHGQRLTTMLVTFPRIVLAEKNTHRMLSRNSASSRAIPFKKMVASVQERPFIPLKWQVDHPGMQGTQYITDPADIEVRNHQWLQARDAACSSAWALNKPYDNFDRHLAEKEECPPVTKQLCNRLLEPFAYHTALITATEWENFFALRANPAAEIHVAHLAELMLEAYNNAEVQDLTPGRWHVPFGDKITLSHELIQQFQIPGESVTETADKLWLKIATARCAQTSYTLVGDDEKPMDYPKLIALHDRLATSGHWSPFEHCAKAMTKVEYDNSWLQEYIEDKGGGRRRYGVSGNFFGFIQYRKFFEGENRIDPRVIH